MSGRFVCYVLELFDFRGRTLIPDSLNFGSGIARAGSLRPCLMLCDERLTEDSLRITTLVRLLSSGLTLDQRG